MFLDPTFFNRIKIIRYNARMPHSAFEKRPPKVDICHAEFLSDYLRAQRRPSYRYLQRYCIARRKSDSGRGANLYKCLHYQGIVSELRTGKMRSPNSSMGLSEDHL